MALVFNRIGFGGIPIQTASPIIARDILSKMAKDGFSLVDSAKGYSVSEAYLGEALIGMRDNFFIASKSMNRTYQGMKDDLYDSLVKFKTSSIDLYQFHNITTRDQYAQIITKDGAYRALKEAKEQGLIKYIGITSHSVRFMNEIIDDGLFDAIMLPFNVVEEEALAVFEKAKSQNMLTIAMKPLCGGVVEDTRLALRYFQACEACDVVLIGMGSTQEYEINREAIKQPLSGGDVKDIASLRINLGQSFCRRCGYCLPCVQGISIPLQWSFDGYFRRYDLQEWAKSKYYNEIKRAKDCIGCKECEKRCPYGLNIADKMREIAKEFDDA